MLNKMIINAISAVLALGVTSTSIAKSSPMQESTAQGMEKCFGIVKAGMNDCGNASHSCSGEAKQDGDKSEWIFLPEGYCKKIVSGSTQAPPKS